MEGWEDKYAIAGAYWPPQYVIMDGVTLEPLKIVCTRGMIYDEQNYHPEPRVASIVASHYRPEFVVNVKETGLHRPGRLHRPRQSQGDLDRGRALPARRRLRPHRPLLPGGRQRPQQGGGRRHQGGQARRRWSRPRAPRRIPAAAPTSSTQKFGPVWATSHLGSEHVTLIGTDPEGHPEHAWKVVQTLEGQGGGSLFVKTHPNSRNLYVDTPLNPEAEIAASVAVFEIDDLDDRTTRSNTRCCRSASGRASRRASAGSSRASSTRTAPRSGSRSGTARTRRAPSSSSTTRRWQLKKVIKDPRIVTPTGKFNVLNTRKDIY